MGNRNSGGLGTAGWLMGSSPWGVAWAREELAGGSLLLGVVPVPKGHLPNCATFPHQPQFYVTVCGAEIPPCLPPNHLS